MATFDCDTCTFFVPLPVQKRKDSQIGACHANPPAIKYDAGSQPQPLAQFPIVISGMWCGFWQEQKKEA